MEDRSIDILIGVVLGTVAGTMCTAIMCFMRNPFRRATSNSVETPNGVADTQNGFV